MGGYKTQILGVKFFNYFFTTLLAQNLSSKKYQTEFAIGSTIASVRATPNVTSAINIKQMIAIAKCPIV